MNKTQIKQTLEYLEKIYQEDKKVNKATKEYFNIVSPESYPPCFEWKLSSILDYLKIEYPEIAELLEYYFYEAKNMDGGWMVEEKDGKKYKYDNHENIIQSMIDFWYIDN